MSAEKGPINEARMLGKFVTISGHAYKRLRMYSGASSRRGPAATHRVHCHFGSSPPIWHGNTPPWLAEFASTEPQAVDLTTLFTCHPSGTRLDTYQGMKAAQDRLVRHLVIAVALKLLVLIGLWWAFVRDERVGVDVDRAAAHLGTPVDANALPTAPSGAPP